MWMMAFVFILLLLSGCKTPSLSTADDAFSAGEYFEAQKLYRKFYNKLSKKEERPLKGEIAYRMGLCYSRLNMNSRAVSSFQNALRYQYPDSMVYFYLGQSLQSEGKYQEAIEAFNSFLDFSPDSKPAKEAVKGCNLSLQALGQSPTRYIVRNVKLFNSSRSDFSPVFAPNELDRLYFTSTNEKSLGESRSSVTGLKFGDIYSASKNENGEWMRPLPLEGDINSENDEGIISFSPDGLTMYLTRVVNSDKKDSRVEIYFSRRSDATWSTPEKLAVANDSNVSVGHPAVDPSGKFLYFTSDMPGGYGGLDIWKMRLGEPNAPIINMGPQINTPGDEMFPSFRSDSLFYFSSTGHPGFGGLDIFKASLNSSGDYWNVENMGIPINSHADDFGITFGEGESGFFSSNRGDIRGYDHIYSFELPDLHITLSGTVTDREENPIAGAIVRIVGDNGTNRRDVSRNDGSYRFNLEKGVNYVMKTGADGYLNIKKEFESDNEDADADYELNFVLTSINKPQVLENIFYDFDKATLRPESKAALDELIEILNENPNVTIEIGSHTDRKGSQEYNLQLSERRAKSVVDYLISSGIEEDRLSYKGYGKTMPKTVSKLNNIDYPQFPVGEILTEDYIMNLNPEDQEAADQINRRTEFRVLSIDYGLF